MGTKIYNCPVEATIDVIGGNWKPLILWWLHQRTHRFAEHAWNHRENAHPTVARAGGGRYRSSPHLSDSTAQSRIFV
jgi:hypothetical protein